MELNNFLASVFISHGFFDVIAMYPDIRNNLALYNTSIILFTLLSFYQTTISFILFIFGSMYHFGKDFEYLIDESTFWAGSTLISTSVVYDIDSWDNMMNWLDIPNNNIIILSVLLMSIQSIIATNNIFAILLSCIIGFSGPYPGLFYYATLIHAPLGMYNYTREFEPFYKFVTYSIWMLLSITIYNILPYINGYITPDLFKVSLGVVITHMITVSLWQENNYLETKT